MDGFDWNDPAMHEIEPDVEPGRPPRRENEYAQLLIRHWFAEPDFL